jgi:hypothetical protein
MMVVLEPPLHKWITRQAKIEGISLSLKIRDLIREAYEAYEDRYWSKEGERRLARFNRKKALTHKQLKRKLGLT